METVAQNFDAGRIEAVAPKKTEQNYEMYNVVRRLKSVSSGAIINHFFRCTICEGVLNVVTAHNHAALARHFKKCSGPGRFFLISNQSNYSFKKLISLNFVSVQIDRDVLHILIQNVARIGAEVSLCDLATVTLPVKINQTNIDQCVAKILSTATAAKCGSK